jgi:hypothetical protein
VLTRTNVTGQLVCSECQRTLVHIAFGNGPRGSAEELIITETGKLASQHDDPLDGRPVALERRQEGT